MGFFGVPLDLARAQAGALKLSGTVLQMSFLTQVKKQPAKGVPMVPVQLLR